MVQFLSRHEFTTDGVETHYTFPTEAGDGAVFRFTRDGEDCWFTSTTTGGVCTVDTRRPTADGSGRIDQPLPAGVVVEAVHVEPDGGD